MVYRDNEFGTAEHLILDSYANTVDALGKFFGSGFEILLYSFEYSEPRMIASANLHSSDSLINCPLNNLVMKNIADIKDSDLESFTSCFYKNTDSEPVHSSNIVIYSDSRKPIGMLRINFFLNTPLNSILLNHIPASSGRQSFMADSFTENADELLNKVVKQIKYDVDNDSSILRSLKNKEIIRRCQRQGLFKIKNSVVEVAGLLNISKNTVYLHLKSIENETA